MQYIVLFRRCDLTLFKKYFQKKSALDYKPPSTIPYLVLPLWPFFFFFCFSLFWKKSLSPHISAPSYTTGICFLATE